jgi:L-lactate transport
MFHQILAPVAGNLFLSFLVGLLPIAIVLVMLGILRRPAWQAALTGLIVGLLVAIGVWQMPIGLAASATANGMLFGLLPVMWIVWNAMWLYNIAVRSGKFELFRRWMIFNVPADKRILLILIGFCFGALMEGVAGFGTPVAIGSALLISLGFPALEAITLTLIFNTTPVAFGALGTPITTLATVTGLHASTLAAMVGRQLPFFSFVLPFYALIIFSGFRSLKTTWPIALVAGGSFALTQFVVSNFVGPELPDVLASLVSLICVIGFVQIWQPRDIEQYRAHLGNTTLGVESSTSIGEENVPVPVATASDVSLEGGKPTLSETLLAWTPWAMVSAVVIVWTYLKVSSIELHSVSVFGLNKAVFLTLYNKPYAALYNFQPFGTGTAILLAVVLTALVVIMTGSSPKVVALALVDTWRQLRFALFTVVLIIGLAYLFNYSGIAYTLGLAISKVGGIFPFFSVFLGWIACFLSGSDTSSNALFGNLQVVAARQLNLSPVLMAASNSSGAVMSKMISPQTVTTGVSTSTLVGKEGLIVARTFKHSIFLAVLLGLLVMAQQYLFPWIIPH